MSMCTTYMLGVLYHCVLKYVLKQLVGIILNGAFFFLLLLHFNKIGFGKLQAQKNFHEIEIMLKGQNCSFKEDLNTWCCLCTVYVTSKELYARQAKRYYVSKLWQYGLWSFQTGVQN